MTMLRHILLRFVLVSVGVSLAMAVSAMAAYPFITFPSPTPPADISASGYGAELVTAIILFPINIVLVALQPLVTISMIWQIGVIGMLAAEVFAWRSWMFHVANGAIAAALAAGSLSFLAAGGEANQMLIGFIAAGAVSGLVYWGIAGRSAGFRLPRSTAPGPPS